MPWSLPDALDTSAVAARAFAIAKAFAEGDARGRPPARSAGGGPYVDRQARSPHGRHGARGKQSENDIWLDLLVRAYRDLAEQAPGCTPCFQMDRGADSWQVLALAQALGLRMTVRAAHDRRVDANARLLWETVEATATRARLRVPVPERPPHAERSASATDMSAAPPSPARPYRKAQHSRRSGRRACPPGSNRAFNAVLVREDRRGDERGR